MIRQQSKKSRKSPNKEYLDTRHMQTEERIWNIRIQKHQEDATRHLSPKEIKSPA